MWTNYLEIAKNLTKMRKTLPSELRIPSWILNACISVLDMSMYIVYVISSSFPLSVILFGGLHIYNWLFPPNSRFPLLIILTTSANIFICLKQCCRPIKWLQIKKNVYRSQKMRIDIQDFIYLIPIVIKFEVKCALNSHRFFNI